MALLPKWCGNKWFSGLYSSTQAKLLQGQPSACRQEVLGRKGCACDCPGGPFICLWGFFFSSSGGRPRSPARPAAVFACPLLAFFPSSCWFKRKDVAEDTCRWWQPSWGPFSTPLLSLQCRLVPCSFERLRF